MPDHEVAVVQALPGRLRLTVPRSRAMRPLPAGLRSAAGGIPP